MEKHSSKRGSSATGKTEEVVSAPKPKKQKIDEAKWNETIDEIAEIFSSKCKLVEIITTSNHLLLLLLFGYVLYLSYLFIFFFWGVASDLQNVFQEFYEKVQQSLETKTAIFQANANRVNELEAAVESLNKTIGEFSKNVSFLYAATNERNHNWKKMGW